MQVGIQYASTLASGRGADVAEDGREGGCSEESREAPER